MAWRSGRLKRLISTLAFEEVEGNGEQRSKLTAMLLHGLLGSGRNWRGASVHQLEACFGGFAQPWTISKDRFSSSSRHSFSCERPGGADQVQAGAQARHADGSFHGWQSCARVRQMLVGGPLWKHGDDAETSKLVIVTSPMELEEAASLSRLTCDGAAQLWVLDSVIGEVPPEEDKEGEVDRATIQQLPNPIPSRRWLVEHLAELGFSKSLANWLGSNLRGISSSTEDATWVFNVNEALDMLISYRKMDYWSLLERPPQGTNIGIVRALKSNRWMPGIVSHLEELAARPKAAATDGSVTYRVLENHVDNPEGLVELLAPSFHNDGA